MSFHLIRPQNCQRPNQSLQSIRAVVSFDLPDSVQELHAGQSVQLTDPNWQCVSCSSVAVLLQDALVPPPLRGNLDGDVQVHRPVCSKECAPRLRQIWHVNYHITATAAAQNRVALTRKGRWRIQLTFTQLHSVNKLCRDSFWKTQPESNAPRNSSMARRESVDNFFRAAPLRPSRMGRWESCSTSTDTCPRKQDSGIGEVLHGMSWCQLAGCSKGRRRLGCQPRGDKQAGANSAELSPAALTWM